MFLTHAVLLSSLESQISFRLFRTTAWTCRPRRFGLAIFHAIHGGGTLQIACGRAASATSLRWLSSITRAATMPGVWLRCHPNLGLDNWWWLSMATSFKSLASALQESLLCFALQRDSHVNVLTSVHTCMCISTGIDLLWNTQQYAWFRCTSRIQTYSWLPGLYHT